MLHFLSDNYHKSNINAIFNDLSKLFRSIHLLCVLWMSMFSCMKFISMCTKHLWCKPTYQLFNIMQKLQVKFKPIIPSSVHTGRTVPELHPLVHNYQSWLNPRHAGAPENRPKHYSLSHSISCNAYVWIVMIQEHSKFPVVLCDHTSCWISLVSSDRTLAAQG